ncbi:MAG TPA: ATP-binding cassette domain-containing protein [Cyclobacteriaceae bacterium]|nr:ATP-binding cassette domain-containing protein [Cyclobacteriaceae bacterium]
MSEIAIHLDNLSHRFGSQVLFQNLSLQIEANKITVILGRSGSGKSTLLQIINGLIVPDEGVVQLFGQPLDYGNIHQARLNIGYAVQQVGLFPHLRVIDNIMLPGKLAGWSSERKEKRAAELMELVSLPSSHANKFPYQLSGGEQQRVGLCRAILLNPPLMLLDEPFSSLDPDTKAEIHQEVLKLKRMEPRCIVMVTHDPEEAQKLGDVLLKFENGELTTTA